MMERWTDTALFGDISRETAAIVHIISERSSYIIEYQEVRKTVLGNVSMHCCGGQARDEQSTTRQTIRFFFHDEISKACC